MVLGYVGHKNFLISKRKNRLLIIEWECPLEEEGLNVDAVERLLQLHDVFVRTWRIHGVNGQ